ncbi:MAG: MMPL family transporter, partial [Planctomycetes bacterium]|nr:MMPL family transporter [Planctomycetota bacterium]
APTGFADATVQRELTELCNGFEALPGTSRTLSLADLVGDGMSPTTLSALGTLGALPAGLLNRAGTVARVLVLREDLGSTSWQQFLAAARGLCARPTAFTAELAGVQLVGTAMVDQLTWDLVWSFFGSLVVIFVLVFLQCRDLRLGICAMLSCLLPLLLVLATMAICGIAVRPLTMIAFCVAFGLMIDDAIHVVARWREERLAGAATPAALQATLTTAGRPVVITTILLLVGFVTILGSEFKGTFAFGLLVSLSLLAALVSALLVLPALLRALVST